MYFVSAWEKIKEGVVISNKLQEMSRYLLLFVIDWERGIKYCFVFLFCT